MDENSVFQLHAMLQWENHSQARENATTGNRDLLTDKVLLELSSSLNPKEFTPLGIELGLAFKRLKIIKADNPNDTLYQNLTMLDCWRNRRGQDEDVISLLEKSLNDVGRKDLSEKIRKFAPKNNGSDARSQDNADVYVKGGPTADFDSQVGLPPLRRRGTGWALLTQSAAGQGNGNGEDVYYLPLELPSLSLTSTRMILTGFRYEGFNNVLKSLISFVHEPYNRNCDSAGVKIYLTLIKLRHNIAFELLDTKHYDCRKVFGDVVGCVDYAILIETRFWKHQQIPKLLSEPLPIEYVVIRKFQLGNDSESEFVPTTIVCTDPCGYIIYGSKVLSGISDDNVLKESGLLEKLKNCPQVKRGYGILISNEIAVPEEVSRLELQIVRCFGGNNVINKAFSKSEMAVRHLKEFKILTTPIERGLRKKLDEIFSLCCFLTNIRLQEMYAGVNGETMQEEFRKSFVFDYNRLLYYGKPWVYQQTQEKNLFFILIFFLILIFF